MKRGVKMGTIYIKGIKTAMQNNKMGKKEIKGSKKEYF